MQVKSWLAMGVLALSLPLACSGSTVDGNDLLFVPEGLPNKLRDEQLGTIALVALTLVQGATGPELYVAVRNDGQMPACEAGMMTSFYDKADQHLTDTSAVLRSARYYRLQPGVVLSCIDPGEIGMAAAMELPDSLVIGELGYLEHRFPLFTVDGIERIDGDLTVSGVEVVTMAAGSAYTGTFTNGLDATVSNPSVTIFPVNRVGRPLGMVRADATMDIPPGGSWSFQTSPVGDLGAGYVAYPGASIPN
jgi:hypothetical protein